MTCVLKIVNFQLRFLNYTYFQMVPTLVLDPKTANAIIAILVMVFVILSILIVGLIMQMPSRRGGGSVHDEEDEEDISKRICCVCLSPPNPNDTPRLNSRNS